MQKWLEKILKMWDNINKINYSGEMLYENRSWI